MQQTVGNNNDSQHQYYLATPIQQTADIVNTSKHEIQRRCQNIFCLMKVGIAFREKIATFYTSNTHET